MVHFNDIVAPQAVATDVSANGKKPLFQKIAQLAASAYGLNATMISEALFERERLGSTGFGGGVAIPHAKIPGLDRMRGVVVLLQAGTAEKPGAILGAARVLLRAKAAALPTTQNADN